ncbi:glycosyltransferase family 4 protein [Methylomonas sp. LL1]|uniref:glycosyltransferase family 4 protein n=1 Tax=Methylomonas sp. LL1 TaxID=2785785 RepID=UPI0018C3F3FA|nr:glycosyltransferase family 4 protein [Methylomonas sp. LL1]QPK63421.1 glycosyltransferase family 4 protein [Methylomonas sp. LL1]
MKIICLCKRRPQGRDLLTRPYGRFFYLPYHLAKQGHDVTILLLGYGDDPPIHYNAHGMDWYTESLRSQIHSRGTLTYLRRARILVQTHKPDWIIGLSDTWYGIMAAHLGSQYGIKILIDAYDNYESYIPWAKPLHWAWRSALKRATALTAAGPELAALISRERAESPATVIPMAADPIFQPINDESLRRRFDLPDGVPLIGYCGALYKNRGVSTLFQAMEYLLNDVPDAKLVLSGRKEQGLKIPKKIEHAVIQLGYLPDEKMPLLLNALDILLVVNRDSAFGNYSYPVKLYEAMQCRKPVIASNVAGTRWVLRNHPECLTDAGNPEYLARHIRDALLWKTKEYTPNCDWTDSALMLSDLLETSQSAA